jgi:hypothetical protein|tara:strand:+ start:136 stop:312 length:177 start_codon:yes stop_codon:yes gene_type:complete
MAAVASRINLLSSQEWNSIGTLTYELSNLKVKTQPSNEEQVVIDWMMTRLDYLNSRKG